MHLIEAPFMHIECYINLLTAIMIGVVPLADVMVADQWRAWLFRVKCVSVRSRLERNMDSTR